MEQVMEILKDRKKMGKIEQLFNQFLIWMESGNRLKRDQRQVDKNKIITKVVQS